MVTGATPARPSTPPRKNPDGTTTMTVGRCCNGCGRKLGDVTDAEMDAAMSGAPLPDVRAECGCAADAVALADAIEYVLPLDLGTDPRRRQIAELAAGSVLRSEWYQQRDARPALGGGA